MAPLSSVHNRQVSGFSTFLRLIRHLPGARSLLPDAPSLLPQHACSVGALHSPFLCRPLLRLGSATLGIVICSSDPPFTPTGCANSISNSALTSLATLIGRLGLCGSIIANIPTLQSSSSLELASLLSLSGLVPSLSLSCCLSAHHPVVASPLVFAGTSTSYGLERGSRSSDLLHAKSLSLRRRMITAIAVIVVVPAL